MDDDELNVVNECRELLLDAGSDPLAFCIPLEIHCLLVNMATSSLNGVSSKKSQYAIKSSESFAKTANIV